MISRILLTLLLAGFFTPVIAQEASPLTEPEEASAPAESPKPKAKAQYGVINAEGATVYKKPDFDDKVLANLPPGLKVVISQKKVQGVGGLGAFFKIRFDKNKIGYVADNEIIPEFQKLGNKAKRNPEYKDVEELREKVQSGLEPIYLTRYLGAQVGMLGFTETFRGKKYSDDMMMYGIKMTGPGVLFDGPPLDLTFVFSPKAPSYYDDFARSPPTGFFVFSDLSLLVPLIERLNFLVYGGLGIMATYTKFSFQTTLDTVNSTSFRIGAVGQVGAAYRRKKWAVRGDAKYYYEKHSYLGYWLSLQREY